MFRNKGVDKIKKLLKKLAQNDFKKFKIQQSGELEFVDESNFEDAQIGFRIDPSTNRVSKDWKKIVGKKFFVVAMEETMGDPILVNTGKKEMPVYFMPNDEWEEKDKIANSFEEFVENLKALDELINQNKASLEEIRKLVEKLEKENEECEGFYERICYDVLDEDGFFHDSYEE